MWERLSGVSGDDSDWIAGDVPIGGAIVEVKSTDKAFKVSGCGTWKPVGEHPTSTSTSTSTSTASLVEDSYSLFVSSLIWVLEESLAEEIFDAMEDRLRGNDRFSEQTVAFTIASINNARKALRNR